MKWTRLAMLAGILAAAGGTYLWTTPEQLSLVNNGINDACGGYYQAKAEVAVSIAPRPLSRTVQTLTQGQGVMGCDEGENWIGIIVPPQDDSDCGVSDLPQGVSRYTGPCVFGWVRADALELIAG